MLFKKNYFKHPRNRRYIQIAPSPFLRVRLNAAKITIFLGLAVALLLIAMDLSRQTITQTLRSVVIDTTIPLIEVGKHASLKVKSELDSLINPSHKYQELLDAKEKVILDWKLEVQRLRRENAELYKLLSYKNEQKFQGITTELIELKPLSLKYKALLPVGQTNGVEKNAVVVNSSGLVGRVIDVGSKTAQVIKLENALCAVPVYIERTQQEGVIKGTPEGGNILLEYVNLSDLQQGDRLLTSGRGGLYPRGINVAVVEQIDQTCVLKPLYSDSRQRVVYILQQNKDMLIDVGDEQ